MMENTMRALDEAYLDVDRGQTANRPRTFTPASTERGRFVANTHEGILVSGKAPGRVNDEQVTIFANGGHGFGVDGGPGYGIQFTAMAKPVYDLARERGLGRELPLDWLRQDVHS
ncbi:MAG: ornithine cyclodeaminase [Chloroflexi bacterium]|nr:ornithine cyclodeaminase [Chloroflexota bacterium]